MNSLVPRIDRLEPNVIVNGAMELAQQGASRTLDGFDGAPTLDYVCDMFGYQSDLGLVLDIDRLTDSPDNNIPNSLRLERKGGASPTTVDGNSRLSYVIEGRDLVGRVGKTFTLFFYVKATNAGNKYVSFYNKASNRSLVKGYTINAADTWELKSMSMTIEDTTWNLDEAAGMAIRWAMQVGSNFHTGSLESWTAGNFFAGADQTQEFETNNDYFQITGVMLLPGDLEGLTDVPFRRAKEDWEDEISSVQRRFEKTYNLNIDPGSVSTSGDIAVKQAGSSAGKSWVNPQYTVRKRAIATPTLYSPDTGASDVIRDNTGNNDESVSYVNQGETSFSFTNPSTFADNSFYSYHWTADANYTTDS